MSFLLNFTQTSVTTTVTICYLLLETYSFVVKRHTSIRWSMYIVNRQKSLPGGGKHNGQGLRREQGDLKSAASWKRLLSTHEQELGAIESQNLR